ncbi:MAG: polysaccharide biosynthesis tyrosine autokinase, partial [Pedobacter sp.]|nr:polysaccharide biosynthesis tyrosine autokinase [Chitinophagaceae bacterium]
FIDQRLNIVTNELENVENTQRDFKIKNGILAELPKEIEANYTEYNLKKKATQTTDEQIAIIDRLDKYVRQNTNKIVPSSFTLTDLPVTIFITDYNKAQLEREKYQSDVLPNNSELRRLDIELASLKTSLFEGLKTLRNNLLAQKNTDKSQQSNAYNYLAAVPDKQKYLQELARQQSLKQALYLYLLQKREEIAIATSTTLSNYQPVDFAQSLGQIEPKESNIKNFGLILGLLIPIGIIYLIDILNDKLTTRDDIVKRTAIPIVGEISHIDKSMDIIVVGQSRNMIAEQFRILRSNLQFLLKRSETCKTFLITSSISGEGKSFMSINLAAVLSLSGKKVALLEFDLRKMRNIQYKGEKQNTKGITNYLIGQTNEPNDIITEIENLPFLHIYRSGPIPPNPGELVMSDRVKTLIDSLKERYDYIVIDSAPVGLVSDSYSLVQYCDSTLYVLRQRYTYKKQVEFIEEINKQGKLNNIALIVNDVHMGGKYGYYGYGNSYGYGYIYRYGFGYRYGYGYGTYTGKYFKKGIDGYFDLPNKQQ